MSLNLPTIQTPTVVSQTKEEEVDRNFLKIIILALAGILFIAGSIYFFNQFIASAGYNYLLWSLLLGSGFLIFAILNVFFIKSLSKIIFILFLQVLAALAFFYERLYPQVSLVLLVGALVFFLFAITAARRGQKVLVNSIKIYFLQVAKVILPRTVSGFLIFLSIILYLNYFSWGKFNEKLGQDFTYQLLDSIEPTFRLWFPNLSFGQSNQEFIEAVARAEIKKTYPEFEDVSPLIRDALVKEASVNLKAVFEKTLGPIDAKETVKASTYRLVKNYLTNLKPKLKSYLGVAAAVAIFFTLKGIAVLLYWLIEVIALIIFKILVITGFAYINLETRNREFILLK